MSLIYDVIIIGAGPAGLTAGIYAGRRAMKTLILSKDLGGQAAITQEIENYPGFEFTTGPELTDKFKKQAEKFGAEFKFGEVKEIQKFDEYFLLKSSQEEFKSQTIILAFGLTPRDLGVPGEERFKGRGVSYCVTCDGPLFKDKIVAVIGGGNSALEGALYLSKITQRVYLIHRRDEFRGDELLVKRLGEQKNIELVLNSTPEEIRGDQVVSDLIIKNTKNNELRNLKINGIFVQAGHIVKADFVKDLVKIDEKNHVVTDKDCQTSTPGVFAAGDVSDVSYKQIVISAGEGAKAALSAYKYIQEKNGKAITVDWGKKK